MHIPYYPKSKPPIIHSTKELLRMQSNGQYLTPDEKKRVKEEAEERRKKNKK
jgi:hypothetical protein